MTLVGRTTETNVLNSALAEAMSGRARVVLVEGAAGCGKTALIDSLAERAAATGCIVLRSMATETERDLPLGVLRQMTMGPRTERLSRVPLPSDGFPTAEAMREFCSALQELSRLAPVVCCVDDLQYTDEPSLRYLQYLTRHTRSAPVLLAATRSLHSGVQSPAFDTELLRRPDFRRVRLSRLGRAGVAQVLNGYPDLRSFTGDIDGLHAISGGNPLLLRALLEEYRAAGPYRTTPRTPLPEPGGLFSQAVVTCLRHSGPAASDLAAALAVLGSLGSSERAAQLLGIPASAAAQGLSALSAAGILDGHRFRHPGARAAVLDGLSQTEQAELHRRAADLLHRTGQSAFSVTRHLLASYGAQTPWSHTPWAVGVLRERAEQLLADEEPRQAARVLELAYEACSDEALRADISIRLAGITWRFSPAVAEKHLAEPLRLARSGRLTAGRMGALARMLRSQGRITEADEMSERFALRLGNSERSVPELSDRHPHTAFWAVPDRSGDPEESTRFLQTAELTDTTLQPVVQAIQSLVHSGRPEQALPWCRSLLEEADRRDAPTWSAVFALLQAEVLLRTGDLRGAEHQALLAWELIPEKNSTVFAAAPAATLVRARTAMGRHSAVAQQLEQPASEALYDTVYLPGYLHARGRHFLATNQSSSALCDFLDAGRALQRWGMDRPVVLPWRTDAAEALLRLGERHQAARLVAQQQSMPDARHPWVRGITLRLRAATEDPAQREPLLEKAVDELRRCGDRIELARAMADLGRVLRARGESGRAAMTIKRAWNLAHACGAETLCEDICPGLTGETEPGTALTVPACEPGSGAKLSDSEHRVAALAAQGYTNREIALKLFITVSTVEQHLTRVYRKLNISRRQDLPVDLQLTTLESA